MSIPIVIESIHSPISVDVEIGSHAVNSQVGETAIAEAFKENHISVGASVDQDVQMAVLVEVSSGHPVGISSGRLTDQVGFGEGAVAIREEKPDPAIAISPTSDVGSAILVEIARHHASAVRAPVLYLDGERAVAITPIKKHILVVAVRHKIQVAIAVEIAGSGIHEIGVSSLGRRQRNRR